MDVHFLSFSSFFSAYDPIGGMPGGHRFFQDKIRGPKTVGRRMGFVLRCGRFV
jgi:hypothetical protein